MLKLGWIGVGVCVALTGACDGGATPATPVDAPADPVHSAEVEATQMPADGGSRPELALSYQAAEDEPHIAAGQRAVRQSPEDVAAYVALASAFMQRARATGQSVHREYARDVIDVARRLDTQAPRPRLLAAMLLLDGHRFEAVIETAQPLITRLPHDPTPHLLIGDAALELGRYERAEAAYQAAIDLRPDLRSYNRVGYMRWLYGDEEGAVAALELALDAGSVRAPESMAWCFTDLGAMLVRRGNLDAAEIAADRASALVEGYGPAVVLRARVLQKRGELANARALLSEAAERSPSADTVLRIVEIDRALGKRDDAREGLAYANTLAEHDPRPLAHFLARHDEQPERALALAKRELKARENVWAWDTLAIAAARSGEIEDAKAALAKARALGTIDARFELHAALVAVESGDSSVARQHLDAALKLDETADPVLVDELNARLGDA